MGDGGSDWDRVGAADVLPQGEENNLELGKKRNHENYAELQSNTGSGISGVDTLLQLGGE